jgi:ABC-type multidrug transport system fused ATPase/permease subunit
MMETNRDLIIKYLKEKKGLLTLLFILSTVLGFSRMYGATFIRPITDSITGSSEGHIGVLILLSCLYQAIFYFSRFAVTILGGRLDQGFALFLRQKLFNHLNRIPFKEFEKKGCGDMQALIRSDSQQASKFLFVLFSRILMNVILIVFSAAYMFTIDLLSTAIFLTTSLTVGFFNYLLARKVRNYQYEARSSFGRLSNLITEGAGIFDTIRLYNAAPFMTSRFKEKREEYNDQLLKKARVQGADGVMRSLVNNTTLFICSLILGYKALSGEASIGDVLLFISLLFQVSAAFTIIYTWMPVMASARAALDRIEEILTIEAAEEKEEEKKEESDCFNLENISFRFDNGPLIIDDISLYFSQGRCYRIIGESGRGKTTLLKIMLGLYHAQGMIINGGTTRPSIGYVPSEPGIFNVSLFENVSLGEENIEREMCRNAAVRLGAERWIDSLCDGWDHKIEEGGSNLSGGQKRVIALMRILVREYPVIILDEPFSDLDKEREKDLNVVLNELKKDSIVIYTSHRENSEEIADEIIAL